MVCIYCGNSTKVTNSRLQKRSNAVWRRRKCLICYNVFSTIEAPELAGALRFESLSGKLSPFETSKLFVSIYESLKHRKQPALDAEALVQTIVQKLLLSDGATISRNQVIEAAIAVLNNFDKAASTAYQAFHKKTN